MEVIIKSDGIVKIPFTELPPEIRTKYGYDPQKAAQFSAALRAADAQRQANTAQQLAAANAATTAQQQSSEDTKNAKWILGKVDRVQDNGLLIQPPRDVDGRVSSVSEEDQLGITDAGMQRFKSERGSLSSDFQAYLAKGGTFFGSVPGMRYIAANWIKSPADYQKYFALEKLYQTKNFLKSLAVYPPIETEQQIFVRASTSGVVDGDFVSLWIVPDATARSEGGSTYRGYHLLGSK